MLIVSNRLPFTIIEKDGELSFSSSSGGLISGLTAFLSRDQGSGIGNQERRGGKDRGLRSTPDPQPYLWVGWPGATVSEDKQGQLKVDVARLNCHPVFIPEEEMDKFYYGFCNSTIWPLFHYFPMYTHYEQDEWEVYKQVNERFADAVAEVIQPGDMIWIHDYHFLLLPALIRQRVPTANIGFFLHIPFPGYEIFRLMPRQWCVGMLEGLLGADLLGFHTHDYTQYFLRSVLRMLGYEHTMGNIVVGDRLVKADTFPMGIDFDRYHDAVGKPEVVEEIKQLSAALPETKMILSIDRLDYTKGILNRLLGYDLFLKQHPEWHRKAVLTLIVIPSRVGVGKYKETREGIDELVGRINGEYGTLDWVPIRYQYTSVPFEQLIALYNTSNVGLVTPLRDGMNLIAKEYIAASEKNHGVLILSEMAGASKELGEAILINPNSKEEIASAILEALEMPEDEQRRRNAAMQIRLKRYDVVNWAEDFVRELGKTCAEREILKAKMLDEQEAEELVTAYQNGKRRLIMLDYDGTLMAFSVDPQEVKPSEQVLDLLVRLCSDPMNDVVVISGRDRATLELWLGHLPVGLIAEHGVWVRYPGEKWAMSQPLSGEWKDNLISVLELYADRLPGAFVEEKEFSLVWHFRAADPELGSQRAQELLDHLVNFTANIDVQILQGHKVIEIKSGGVNKGTAGLRWLKREVYDFVLAVGDDWTDEYLFAALPTSAYTVRVGLAESKARFNLHGPVAVLELLENLARVTPVVVQL